MRQQELPLWSKEYPLAQEIRRLAYEKNRSYFTYRTYIENSPAVVAANTLICLIHQANYLLDQQLRQLEKEFIQDGGFTEKLYHARVNARNTNWNKK